MLARAYSHKESLTREILRITDDPYYDNYWANYVNFSSETNIKDSNWEKQQWVSLDSSFNVVGFFEANIDRCINAVDNIAIINFKKSWNSTFSLDLKTFIVRLFLRYNYQKINFSVVVDSRNEKIYDKFISKYGGRIVGIFQKHKILQDGTLKDMKYYEILKENFEAKVKKIHPKEML